MTKWEEPDATSSTNGTVLCCILPWQPLAQPCCWITAALQSAELFLFYIMEQVGDRWENTLHIAVVHYSNWFSWAILPLTTSACTSHSLLGTIHAAHFSGWFIYAKSSTSTSWNIFLLGNFALLCHAPPYPPSLLHHVSSGSSSLLSWDFAFSSLLQEEFLRVNERWIDPLTTHYTRL